MGPEDVTTFGSEPTGNGNNPGNDGLLLVGCGKMGGAMLRGWLEGGFSADEIAVIEPSRASVEPILEHHAVRVYDSIGALGADYRPGIIVFAIKPQMMDEAVPDYRTMAEAGALIMSIAAGKTINYYENKLTKAAGVVRAMPNTPASVGRGVTAAISNMNVTEEERALCDELLSAVGQVVWLTDEAQMDAVTAVSGGGPAYVFLLVECLAAAAEAEGLPPDLAMQLARITVAGAGELLHQSADPAAKLRKAVTSPGGTTEAAIQVLHETGAMRDLMARAIHAATERSKDLGG